jgi:flagellar protein FlaG
MPGTLRRTRQTTLTPDTALRQHEAMSQQQQAKVKLLATPDYREGYANSVQVRVNLWDFFLQFGTVNQTAADEVEIRNFQGVYLSPQQAKALTNILTQNITQYERAFGEIKIDPNAQQAGAIN